ncbi:hypothetical protein HYS91_05530 [Candidatus Daviesbacteria bacterium]|nr:hypothetical protein [Candidatus Daviesbacteria bacterium]
MKKFLIGAAASAKLFASSAIPVFAHEGHASCQLFGITEAAFAQDLDGNGTKGLGEFASVLNPVNDEVAFFHTFCEPLP